MPESRNGGIQGGKRTPSAEIPESRNPIIIMIIMMLLTMMVIIIMMIIMMGYLLGDRSGGRAPKFTGY